MDLIITYEFNIIICQCRKTANDISEIETRLKNVTEKKMITYQNEISQKI